MPDADRFTVADLPPLRLDADFWSLRLVDETLRDPTRCARTSRCPSSRRTDRGAMATVYADGGYGYAATGDTSPAGLARGARARGAHWARATAKLALFDSRTLPRPAPRGEYASPSFAAPRAVAPRLVRPADARNRAQAAIDPRIVDWEARVDVRTRDAPARHQRRAATSSSATASCCRAWRSPRTPTASRRRARCNGYRGICQQGGDEILARFGFDGGGRRIAEEALELLAAPNCPSGTMDVLLMPDQMILQIHESIGHPLELDRILGDERNFAGTSFVTPDMFGTLPLRLRAAQRHVRPDARRGARELRLRRRRHAAPSACT